jgi:DNA-binding LacI/PurR family transcriptional regulator
MAVTIYDVARAAGVGVGTVSRVLNNSQAVKASTRERVLEAINRLNYAPDPIARSMITGRTRVLGVIIAFVTRNFSVEVLRSMIRAASLVDYELVIYNVESDEQRDHYFKQLPMRRRVDGLLVVSLRPNEETLPIFLKSGLPIVLVDAYSPEFTSIVVDNMEGAYLAVKNLIEKGHHRIGFINGTVEGNFKFNQANDRLIGVHRAFSEAGIVFDPELMVATDWTREGGRSAAEQFLTLPEPPTAIFAASDIQAVGVLETARRLNLEVPGDLSVMGFDGVELSDILEISTIQQPMEEMGELGMSKMMELLENENKAPELIRLDTFLLERRTTASPKKKSLNGQFNS